MRCPRDVASGMSHLIMNQELAGHCLSNSENAVERVSIDVCSAVWNTYKKKKYLDNPALPEQVGISQVYIAGQSDCDI